MIISKFENFICQINFYADTQTLVKLGESDESVKFRGGRVETFEVSEDEKLIGCKLFQNKHYFLAVQWLKMKVFRIWGKKMKVKNKKQEKERRDEQFKSGKTKLK